MRARVLPLVVATVAFSLASSAGAARAMPTGPHPRIWLDDAARSAMNAKKADPTSATARAIAECTKVTRSRADIEHAVYQGQNWAHHAASCSLAYSLTGEAGHAATALVLLSALLDDYQVIGDGKGGDGVVRHDDGYAIRFFAPYAALAYDWLHDAPGMTETLRAHARERFRAWIDWYDRKGYLPHDPGANYEAGYVFAKTMVAIAAAGDEPQAAGWFDSVTTDLVGRDIVGKGLSASGGLRGGDWPEGWQYGALSVLEYALVTRALEQQHVDVTELSRFASDGVLRWFHGRTPAGDAMYVGGDTSSPSLFLELSRDPLLSGMIAGSDAAASMAASALKSIPASSEEFPAIAAVAEARAVKPVDFPRTRPTTYLAAGTRTVYARSSWADDAFWTVFTSPPRLVPDHQHLDASSFVLARGKDALMGDPSPYGTRATSTSNAFTVESATPPAEYKGTQMPEGEAELRWVRSTRSGVVAARADLGRAFLFKEATDVKLARRDWVFLPEGEIVVIDRARTADRGLSAFVRFRSPAALAETGAPLVFAGDTGGSRLAIHAVSLSGGRPEIRNAKVVKDVSGPPFDYEVARLPSHDYRVALPGPSPRAVHVLDALAAGEKESDATPLSAPANEPAAGENKGVLGAVVRRSGHTTVVVSSAAESGEADAVLSYGAPGQTATRHVVFDAANKDGKATVSGAARGTHCVLTIGGGGATLTARPLVFQVSPASQGCAVTEDLPQAMATIEGGSAATAWTPAEPPPPPSRAATLLRSMGKKKLAVLVLAVAVATFALVAAIVRLWRRRRAFG